MSAGNPDRKVYVLCWFSFPEKRKKEESSKDLFTKIHQSFLACDQSGPVNRLNAILSLLQPLDRYRAPSAIGSAIERALSRPISLPCPGESSQPPRSKPLRGLNRAIVAL